MSHPKGYTGLWEGIEVEGRLRGVRTMFVGEGASLAVVREKARCFPHVFVNPESFDEHGLDVLRAATWACPLVTACVTVPQYRVWEEELSRSPAHVMLAVDLDGPIDQVRLRDGTGVRVSAGWVRTDLAEYANDELLRGQ